MTGVRPYPGSRILLGVSGGIASYKSAWLARLLVKAGAEVDVVMTPAAQEFIGAITFEALTGRPVHTGLFDPGRALDHITLARSASAIVVAPATADFLARAAAGQANDLLTACLLAAACPVLLVPAMNDHMWAHPQTLVLLMVQAPLSYLGLNLVVALMRDTSALNVQIVTSIRKALTIVLSFLMFAKPFSDKYVPRLVSLLMNVDTYGAGLLYLPASPFTCMQRSRQRT